MKRILRGTYKVIRNFIRYIRHGGITRVNIIQIEQNRVLEGKKILVTGGSSGIGLGIAKKMHAMGAEILITGRDEKKLETACKVMGKERINSLVWDIAKEEQLKRKFAESVVLLEGLDIVINNAGVYTSKKLLNLMYEDWDQIIDTNLKASYFICQMAAEHFIRNKTKGKIINIVSNRAFYGDDGPYGASKWGLRGLTYGLARDLIQYGIIVNGIAPGMTATGINNIDVSDSIYSEAAKNKRVSVPEEIAEVAGFLASGAADNIVGQVIICDGGDSLR